MIDQVNGSHKQLFTRRTSGKPVVMLSLEEYSAMDEALIFFSPANAKALKDAISRLGRGDGIARTVDGLEVMERHDCQL